MTLVAHNGVVARPSSNGDIALRITGTSPLLCHNPRLADPFDEFAKELAAVSSKRRKTEEDYAKMARIEWYGGLYIVPGIDGPAMPTKNLRKCLIQAGKVTRNGKDVERALILKELYVPLQYRGSRNIDELYSDGNFTDRASVRVSTNRVMRTRPVFQEWHFEATGMLIPDVMDLDDFRRVLELAGQIEGLGDARTLGYGRFEGEVTSV